MALSRLVLWRHGETDYNASGRMQGHLDSALTETGWNQARFAVPVLAKFAPELVVASDLRRATDTATVFTSATGVPLRIDDRLRETNLGKWQGRTASEIEEEWPGVMHSWQHDPQWAPPGGESRVDVAARAARVVAELDRDLHGTVMLCAHGGLIVALTARLLGLPLPVWPQLAGIGNCHWTVFTRRPTDDTPTWRLSTYNAGITG
ncbi:histidine phosphatase family protein [Goodfellowiella coeruleoviolacea]|uniref:Glucosyl-3-phosphoglycerate phosphatase (Pgm family) n=1 Tax=Goodfellowiella coeruleoviolacea TaxID=334858 RepID=A0AAE3KK72_9PSEU|nr:histidine phosphatase family protein [Goodfellowiella coeruleoviolacea]MCP2165128.1 glucosyl-3-phosphoglycerate phosphatase (pgm family) [Goodfellowiella coeruleoviolacea]